MCQAESSHQAGDWRPPRASADWAARTKEASARYFFLILFPDTFSSLKYIYISSSVNVEGMIPLKTTYFHKCPFSETTLNRVKLNLSHTLQHRRMAWVDARDCVIRLCQAVRWRGMRQNKISGGVSNLSAL